MSRVLYVIEHRSTPDGAWVTGDSFTSAAVAEVEADGLAETYPDVDYRVVRYVPEVKS